MKSRVIYKKLTKLFGISPVIFSMTSTTTFFQKKNEDEKLKHLMEDIREAIKKETFSCIGEK